jgi:hypothetical protein
VLSCTAPLGQGRPCWRRPWPIRPAPPSSESSAQSSSKSMSKQQLVFFYYCYTSGNIFLFFIRQFLCFAIARICNRLQCAFSQKCTVVSYQFLSFLYMIWIRVSKIREIQESDFKTRSQICNMKKCIHESSLLIMSLTLISTLT